MKVLKIVLWIPGIGCLLAILGIILPLGAIENIAVWFGMEPFPNIPIVVYFTKIAFGVFVLVGIFFIILAGNPLNYGPMLYLSAYGLILFGLLALIVGFSIRLPLIIYFGKGLFSIVIGIVILVFSKKGKQIS